MFAVRGAVRKLFLNPRQKKACLSNLISAAPRRALSYAAPCSLIRLISWAGWPAVIAACSMLSQFQLLFSVLDLPYETVGLCTHGTETLSSRPTCSALSGSGARRHRPAVPYFCGSRGQTIHSSRTTSVSNTFVVFHPGFPDIPASSIAVNEVCTVPQLRKMPNTR